jgi:hypothetical protein
MPQKSFDRHMLGGDLRAIYGTAPPTSNPARQSWACLRVGSGRSAAQIASESAQMGPLSAHVGLKSLFRCVRPAICALKQGDLRSSTETGLNIAGRDSPPNARRWMGRE